VIEEEIRKRMSSIANDQHAASFKETPETEPESAIDNFEFNLSLLIHFVKKHVPMKRPYRCISKKKHPTPWYVLYTQSAGRSRRL